MDLKQAKKTINQAINVAIKSGCFDLAETQAIIHALETINSQPDVEFGEIKTIEKE
jgi:hypothetical protein